MEDKRFEGKRGPKTSLERQGEGRSAVTKPSDYRPSLKLEEYVEVLLSPDVMGNKTEAQRRVGYTRQTFNEHYCNSPDFRDWYERKCDEVLGRNRAIADTQLVSQMKQGKMKAIRTYYELQEKLGPNAQRGANKGGNKTLVLVFGGDGSGETKTIKRILRNNGDSDQDNPVSRSVEGAEEQEKVHTGK